MKYLAMNLTKKHKTCTLKAITQNNCWKKWRIIYIDENILQDYRSENVIKMAVKAKVVSCVRLFATP